AAARAARALGRFEQLRQPQAQGAQGAKPQELPAAEAVAQAGQAGAEADHRGPLNAPVAAIVRRSLESRGWAMFGGSGKFQCNRPCQASPRAAAAPPDR